MHGLPEIYKVSHETKRHHMVVARISLMRAYKKWNRKKAEKRSCINNMHTFRYNQKNILKFSTKNK